jgi:hypothetical protein
LPAPEYPPAPCAYCGEAGHNARWCPTIPDDFEWPTPEYLEWDAEFEAVETSEELEWIESHLDPDNDYQPRLAYYKDSAGRNWKVGMRTILEKKFMKKFGRPSGMRGGAEYAFIIAEEVEEEYQQRGRSPWGFPNWSKLRERLHEVMPPSPPSSRLRKNAWGALCQILDIRYPELTMGRGLAGVGITERTGWEHYMNAQKVPYTQALRFTLQKIISSLHSENSGHNFYRRAGQKPIQKEISPVWKDKGTFRNDMMLLYVAQGGRCAVTGRPFPTTSYPKPIIAKGKVVGSIPTYKNPWDTPSIDRIDNTIGYQPDNVRLVSLGIQLALNKFPDVSLIDMGLRGITSKKLHTFIQPDGDMMNLLVPNENQGRLYLDPEGPYGFTLGGVGSVHEAEGNDEESPHTRAIAGVSDSVAKFANANDTDDWAYAFGGLVAGFVLLPLVGTLISGWLMSKLKKRNLIPWEKDDAEQG